MNEKSMSDLLSQLESIKTELQKQGIAPELADRIVSQLDAYINLKEEIIKARDTQFRDDAYSIATELQAASNKNVARLAHHLRAFAEYVVSQTRGLDGPVNDLVDRVAPMGESEADNA